LSCRKIFWSRKGRITPRTSFGSDHVVGVLGQAGDRSGMPVMWAKLRQAAKRCCLLSFATRHEPDHAPCTFKPPGDGDHFFHRLLNVVFTDELVLTTSQNNSTGLLDYLISESTPSVIHTLTPLRGQQGLVTCQPE
jgi:hypothetical protein